LLVLVALYISKEVLIELGFFEAIILFFRYFLKNFNHEFVNFIRTFDNL
jgi:hypothetical protein